ncbi:MAG: aminopeptidase [Thermoflexales bacterium]
MDSLEQRRSALLEQQARYAEVLVRVGVNLQPNQGLLVSAELAHAPFVRLVSDAAYQAGAKYVHVAWTDTPLLRSRMLHSQPEHLDYVPAFEIARHRQAVDEGWARLALVGDEFPDIFEDVPAAVMRRVQVAKSQALRFYNEALMSNQVQWCVGGVPNAAWAKKVFPALEPAQALQALWELVLRAVRADAPDPIAAWRAHDQRLKRVAQFLTEQRVRAVRYFDPRPVDGAPASDLTIGLTDAPVWVSASSVTPQGVPFIANMPTEEVFTSPHRLRANGWVRTSKPCFPMMREVRDAFFRLHDGEVVEFRAAKGQEVLAEFFQIRGARRLGEISLVDVRSPINQSGALFYETLFDENAACHIAFGAAYTEGMHGAQAMDEQARESAGLNQSDTHVDVMIGTPTMDVYGICEDGSQVTIMRQGRFVDAIFASA